MYHRERNLVGITLVFFAELLYFLKLAAKISHTAETTRCMQGDCIFSVPISYPHDCIQKSSSHHSISRGHRSSQGQSEEPYQYSISCMNCFTDGTKHARITLRLKQIYKSNPSISGPGHIMCNHLLVGITSPTLITYYHLYNMSVYIILY